MSGKLHTHPSLFRHKTHIMTKQLLLFSALFGMLFGLRAQVSPNTKGIFINASLSGATVYYDEDNADDNAGAGGLDIRVGYGFTPTFTLYATLGGYQVSGEPESVFTEDYDLGLFELVGRFHFGKKIKSPIFYLDGGFQFVSAQVFEDPNITLNGSGLVLGPGLLLYLNRKFALDINLRIGAGRINEIEVGRASADLSEENFNYGINRFNVGVVWYPSNR